MGKRVGKWKCAQRTERERFAIVKELKAHPEWSYKQASEILGVKKPTLINYKKLYWDKVDTEESSDDLRKRGGGRKHRPKPYEPRVLDYYDTYLREDGACSFADLLSYCRNVDEFKADITNDQSQKVWVHRFIERYKVNERNGAASDAGANGSGDNGDRSSSENASSGHGGSVQVDADISGGGTLIGATERLSGENGHDDGGSVDCDDISGANSDVDDAAGSDDCSEVVTVEKSVLSTNSVVGTDAGSINTQSASGGSIGGGTSGKRKARTIDIGEEDSSFEISSSDGSDVEMAHIKPASHWFFCTLYPKNDPVVSWAYQNDFIGHRVVHVYPADLDSLLPTSMLTETAIDYYIYRYMVNVPGLLYMCGTSTYRIMDRAATTRTPKLKQRRYKELVGLVKWGSYKYVFLPVCGRNHWSLAIVVNAFQEGPSRMYHVNSLKNAHSAAYAFDIIKGLLEKERQEQGVSSSQPPSSWECYAYNTKPQQVNSVDCGIYLMHYMNQLSRRIAEKKSQSIVGEIEQWTKGSFNATKADQSRISLRARILKDATAKTN